MSLPTRRIGCNNFPLKNAARGGAANRWQIPWGLCFAGPPSRLGGGLKSATEYQPHPAAGSRPCGRFSFGGLSKTTRTNARQGTRREMHNPALIDWIRQASTTAELVLSVCTGALLLAKAGLLDGLNATTHHGAIDLLRQTAPNTTVHPDRRFVDNGRVVCSAGIAAGIDMSLHVVGSLLGKVVAEKTARQMEYP